MTNEISSADTEKLRISADKMQSIESTIDEEKTSHMPHTQGNRLYVSHTNVFSISPNIYSYVVVKELRKKSIKSRMPSVLKTNKAQTFDAVQSFKLDVYIHTSLNIAQHSVIKLLAWFEDDIKYCIIYEYAANGDLLDTLNRIEIYDQSSKNKNMHRKQYKNNMNLFKKLCRQQLLGIALSIQFMHSHGWAHKDLSLENILLDADNHFCLHDFGLCQQFISDQQKTQQPLLLATMTGHWSGKFEHMSPENFETCIGRRTQFDAYANDVWSFAIICICCFSSESFPWQAPDLQSDVNYCKMIGNMEYELEENIFKISAMKEKNENTDKNEHFFLLLIDLLCKILVEEKYRLNITQVVNHPFFREVNEQKKYNVNINPAMVRNEKQKRNINEDVSYEENIPKNMQCLNKCILL